MQVILFIRLAPFTGRPTRSRHHTISDRQSQQGQILQAGLFLLIFFDAQYRHAPTFIAHQSTSFLAFVLNLVANLASSTSLLAWRRYQEASSWNDPLRPPNQLVNSPLPKHETKNCGVVHTTSWPSSHIAATNASTHDPIDGHKRFHRYEA